MRLRGWFRPPRRLRVLRAGWFTIAGTLALGFATLNTSNNLLYLLLGALLGTIALSGWMSEHAMRALRIARAMPGATTAGSPARIEYRIAKGGSWLGTYDVEISERVSGPAAPFAERPAYVPYLTTGESTTARAMLQCPTRGVFELSGVTLATTFPFGMFRKERDIALPGRIVVWPRTDRRVRSANAGAARGRAQSLAAMSSGRARGDYRGLRPYRGGDERRDIHWKSTARTGELVVREYEQDAAESYWIVLDTVAPDPAAGETAIEVAAALIVRAARRGDRCGLVAGNVTIEPQRDLRAGEALLDVLAAVEVSSTGPQPLRPAEAAECVLVTARAAAADAWGDVFHVTSGEP